MLISVTFGFFAISNTFSPNALSELPFLLNLCFQYKEYHAEKNLYLIYFDKHLLNLLVLYVCVFVLCFFLNVSHAV